MIFAENYIHELSELFLGVEVADGNGKEIPLSDAFEQTVRLFLRMKETKKKIMLIGNGGSAAIANHLQTDLINLDIRAATFYQSSMLTALANDFGYDAVFERCTKLWADTGDLYIAISSSGNSINILRGVQAARKRENTIITFSGFIADNKLCSLGDVNYHVARSHYGLVETTHSMLAHSLIDYYLSKYTLDD